MSSAYRRRALKEHGDECVECGSSDNIEVHHLDGDRGNNDLENLIPLCRVCHRELHRSGLNGLEEQLKPIEERSHIDETVTTFGFTCNRDIWRDWKRTVPRDKSLEKRINELIRADTEGRVTGIDVDAVRDDLERGLEHREWAAVEDALARLEDDDE